MAMPDDYDDDDGGENFCRSFCETINSKVIDILENIDYNSNIILFYNIPIIIYILEDTIKKLAEYLGIGADEIEDKLKAGWVKADSFVPVATIPKIQEVDLLTVNPDKTVLEEKEKQDTLLKIPGIMLSDVKVRTYYLKEAASLCLF
jgi:hypothetical protein